MTKAMKKTLSLIIVILMVLSGVPVGGLGSLDFSFATKASAFEATGSLGDNVTYTFDEATGVLTVSGTGATYDYSSSGTYDMSPLYGNKDIKKIVIEAASPALEIMCFSLAALRRLHSPTQ